MTGISPAVHKMKVVPKHSAVLLFDGECGLCNGSVQFILKHERKSSRQTQLQFAPLQSEGAKLLLASHPFPKPADTMVFIEAGRLYVRSDAAVRVAGYLKWPWKAAGWLVIFPPFVRNLVYNFVARHRYGWFGKVDACAMPSPALKARLLDGV